jgi:peptidoglycan/xylan/chitin deacetylase (PgdA/CDA1 family)
MHGPWGAPPAGLPGVLAYHKVGTAELGGTWCTRWQFASHLDALVDAGYHSIDSTTFESLRTATTDDGAPTERHVLLTFDDAFESFAISAWPELRQRNLRALLFVVSGFVGRNATWDLPLPGRRVRHLSWSALRDLVADGVEIGSHTASHTDARRWSAAQGVAELHGSRRTIEDQLGVAVRTLSWPFGSWTLAACQAAQQAGYTMCFGMSPRGRNDRLDAMTVPRRGVYVTDSATAVLDKLDATRAGFWWQDLFTRGVGAVASLTTHLQKDGLQKDGLQKDG